MVEIGQIDERGGDGLDTVIDSEVTDHCFVDIIIFTEYKRFSLPLAGKIAEKKMNFMIVGQGTVKMTIEIENGRIIDLILYYGNC